MILRLSLLAIFIFLIPFSSAAHFILGQVQDAYDDTSSNGKNIFLWNPAEGVQYNLSDVIGPSGESGIDRTYLIDCENTNLPNGQGLLNPCQPGDILTLKVFDEGGYATHQVNVTVSVQGFDVVQEIRLNSPPSLTQIIVDDSVSIPQGEIDLTVADVTNVVCSGVVTDYDGDSDVINIYGEFFDNTISSYGDSDDNNYHYTNSTCNFDSSYGNGNETSFSCNYEVEYYANAGNWNCTVSAFDNLLTTSPGSNLTLVNELLAVGLPDVIDYGIVDGLTVSDEIIANVTNYGNVQINLSLSGYAASPGDGLAMNCTQGNNISINYERYNLTSSNSVLDLLEFETYYSNLTSDPAIKQFNLPYRQIDSFPLVDDTNSTYWRIYVPTGAAGDCSGNIIFGASRAAEF